MHIPIAVSRLAEQSQPAQVYDDYNRSLSALAEVLDSATAQLQAQYEASEALLVAANAQQSRFRALSELSFSIEPTSVLLASEASMERVMSTVSDVDGLDAFLTEANFTRGMTLDEPATCLDMLFEAESQERGPEGAPGIGRDERLLKEELMQALLSGTSPDSVAAPISRYDMCRVPC